MAIEGSRWHVEHYIMRVEQRMQVSDITHSVLAFNVSGGCSTAGGRHRNVRLGYPQSMLETWPL